MGDPLIVGVPYVGPSAIGWPLLAAEKLGLYEAEGLDVRLTAGSYDELSRGISSGSMPIIRRGPDADIVLMERGEPVRIVAGIVAHPMGDIVARPAITTMEQLRGATFGVIDERVGSTLQLKTILARAGIRPGEYQLRVYGGSPQRLRALESGEIDGALLSPPSSYRAIEAGLSQVVRSSAYLPDYLSSSIQVHVPFAERNPDVVTRYVRATIRGIRWLYEPANRSDAIALIDDGTDAPEATYHDLIEVASAFPYDGDVPRSGLRALVDALSQMGDIGQPTLVPEAYVLGQFQKEALTTLGAPATSEATR